MKDIESDGWSSDAVIPLFDRDGSAPAKRAVRNVPSALPFERKRYPLLSQTEVNALCARIAQGDQAAKDKLVVHNMGLAYSIARRYLKSGVPYEDLVQEGAFGVMKAVERFDPSRGYAFSTYATWWIRRYIVREAVEASSLIRLPVYMQVRVGKVLGAMDKLLTQGVIPTVDQLARALGFESQTVEQALVVFSERQCVSLDAPMMHGHEGTESTMGEIIPDSSAPGPSIVLEARQQLLRTVSQIGDLLGAISSTFGERDYQVFVARYGLDAGREQRTFADVGAIFSITRERVRQVIQRVWQRFGNHISETDFTRFLGGAPALEELAGMELCWQNLPIKMAEPQPNPMTSKEAEQHALLIERMRMLRATARERLADVQYTVFSHHYGLEVGGRWQTQVETAVTLGLSKPSVHYHLNRSWCFLSSYARHFNRENVNQWVKAISRTEKASG